jgi:hypothetical protein
MAAVAVKKIYNYHSSELSFLIKIFCTIAVQYTSSSSIQELSFNYSLYGSLEYQGGGLCASILKETINQSLQTSEEREVFT